MNLLEPPIRELKSYMRDLKETVQSTARIAEEFQSLSNSLSKYADAIIQDIENDSCFSNNLTSDVLNIVLNLRDEMKALIVLLPQIEAIREPSAIAEKIETDAKSLPSDDKIYRKEKRY